MVRINLTRQISTALAVLTLSTGAVSGEEVITKATWFSDWGDVKYNQPFEHLDYVNPDAPKGGEITIGTVGTFDSMNPFATHSGTPAALSSSGYERLMSGTSDEYISGYYCLLCETLEYPESQDWVVFNLRKDVTFSDGTPMTAHDVVFSHELFVEQGTPSYASAIKALYKTYEALDDHTIKVTFQPDSAVSARIGQVGSSVVFQKKWYEETGARLDEKRYEISPGTGPYMLSDYDPGQWVTYKRNPDYWGIDHPLMKGRSNFDTQRVLYFGDTTAAFEAFKSGEITFRQENSSLKWATGYDFPALENEWVVKKTLHKGAMPAAYGFLFNLRKEKFQDLRVRQAIGLMYNFTWTNETLQYGLFSQRDSFWDVPDLKATGLPEGAELAILEGLRDDLPAEIFTEEAFLPHTSGTRSLDRRNLRKALALLEEAGYTPDDAGKLRSAAGDLLTLEFLHYSPAWDRIINPYIENLVALGVDAKYNRIDANQYQARTQSFDYDMIYDGYVNGFEEGSGFGQKFGSDSVDDVFNPAGYGSAAIDEIGEIILEAETYDDMKPAIRAADRILRHEYFIVPAHKNDTYWVSYFDMYEHPTEDAMPPLALGYLDFWWYNADKAAALKAAGAIK